MNKIYKKLALMTAGVAFLSSIYGGQAEAAVPKKEKFPATCQILREAASKTSVLDHCTLHIAFSAVNNDDRIIYTANNIIAAYENGSKTFLEGNIEKNTIIGGNESAVVIPYYILRNGRSYTCYIRNGENWKVLPLPVLAQLAENGYGLQELFKDNKTAECLNETDKGRTVVFRDDLVTATEMLFSLITAADLLPAPDLGPGYQPKEKPSEVFIRQDYTRDIISDINVDATSFVQGYLKQRPKALTANDQQSVLRTVLAKGSINLHVSVYGTDKKTEFHDIYAELPKNFDIDIPRELLSPKQLKDRENGAPIYR